MKNPVLTLVLLLTLIFPLSCERYVMAPDPENTPLANYEFLWQELDHKYSFFEYKSIDWDSVYAVFRPQIYDDMDERELFGVLADMLNTLQDGHVNLLSSFDRSRNWDWYLDYPENFNGNIVYRNYLGKNYKISGPLHHQIIDSVLYVYYASFGNQISQDNLDALMKAAEGMKGVIVDIRNNGGGSSANAYALASCFTEDTLHFGYERIKNGPGHDDFSPWRSLQLTPRSGKRFAGNVVLLCNRNSYSASNLFALMMDAIEQVRLMGDRTGGGGGTPAYGELPNGWQYRFSSTQTLDPESKHVEHGIAVDIPVNLDPADEAAGIDSIIEAALDLLK